MDILDMIEDLNCKLALFSVTEPEKIVQIESIIGKAIFELENLVRLIESDIEEF